MASLSGTVSKASSFSPIVSWFWTMICRTALILMQASATASTDAALKAT